MARPRLFIPTLTLLFWAAPVHAVTVAIVRPAIPSPSLTETLSRLHGELLSVGLQVEIADRPATLSPGAGRAWLEGVASEREADAIIDIVGERVPAAVDVWIIDKTKRTSEVSRVALEPNTENASERLAIRALEVLRSSFLEIDLAARERHSASVARTAAPTLPINQVNEPASRPERFGLAVGGAVLTSLDGVGAELLPVLRLDWSPRSWLVVHAALAGLGSRPTVANMAGSARVAQQYGVMGAGYRFRTSRWLKPFVGLSAGALRTSVDGQADSAKQGHSAAQWSFLLEGSIGTGLHLGGRYYLTLAAHVQIAQPFVAIHFVDQVVATSGRPNLLFTLTVGAWL